MVITLYLENAFQAALFPRVIVTWTVGNYHHIRTRTHTSDSTSAQWLMLVSKSALLLQLLLLLPLKLCSCRPSLTNRGGSLAIQLVSVPRNMFALQINYLTILYLKACDTSITRGASI